VIAIEAKTSGVSVAAMVQTSGIPIHPLPGMGAPGRHRSDARETLTTPRCGGVPHQSSVLWRNA
jgi:hypothetical protein